MERVEVQVTGMHCGNCENAISKTVGALTGVRAVTADHATGRVSIETDALDREAVGAAIHDAGFELVVA